jgi:hypothetical protein
MEKSMFFSSISGDRTYFAKDFAEFFHTFLGNGVFLQDTDGLLVTAGSSGLTVTVTAGKAYINGYAYINDSALPLTLDQSTGNRIDRIIIRCDMTAENRKISAAIKKGANATAGNIPVAPDLTRTADIWELGIADIALPSGVTSITPSQIADLRNDGNYCGGVTLTVDRQGTIDDITNAVSTFTTPPNRTNIAPSDKAGGIFGKIAKWFTDLKALAFKDKVAAGDIAAGAITNADINAAAAIAFSKIDTNGIDVSKLGIATTSSNSDNTAGYIKFFNGFIIQWGAGNIPANANYNTISFYTPFSISAVTNIFLSNILTSGAAEFDILCAIINTLQPNSTFIVRRATAKTTAVTFRYVAIGYAAI